AASQVREAADDIQQAASKIRANEASVDPELLEAKRKVNAAKSQLEGEMSALAMPANGRPDEDTQSQIEVAAGHVEFGAGQVEAAAGHVEFALGQVESAVGSVEFD